MSPIPMQVVIPMSGRGDRFRRAGYQIPKPLIPVEGKPILQHIVEALPGAARYVFLCAEDHLADPDLDMAGRIRSFCPQAVIQPVPVMKKGPVAALQAGAAAIDPDLPVLVNYCDFAWLWDFADFHRFTQETGCEGAILCYRGFHPHMLGSTNYAYVREQDLWVQAIQEKQPYTDQPMQEFASSGSYWFASGRLLAEAMAEQVAQDLLVNGEYYVSLTYRPLLQQGRRIAVYEIPYFFQWGTPQDLEEWQRWADLFRRQGAPQSETPALPPHPVVVPMAGAGKRFADAGYRQPKPLIPISGRPMAVQAVRDLPPPSRLRLVLRQDLPDLGELLQGLQAAFPQAEIVMLPGLTEGQAITCAEGAKGLDPDQPVTFAACDNGMLWDRAAFARLMAAPEVDVIVWTIRGHPDARRRPKQFGWVLAEPDGRVTGTLVKQEPADPARDPVITGTVTFRRLGDFQRCLQRLIAQDRRVNGEFYLDSTLDEALALGLTVRSLDIDHYLGWGTPQDLQSFRYFQAALDLWPSHPYRLEADPDVAAEAILGLRAEAALQPAARPGTVAR